MRESPDQEQTKKSRLLRSREVELVRREECMHKKRAGAIRITGKSIARGYHTLVWMRKIEQQERR